MESSGKPSEPHPATNNVIDAYPERANLYPLALNRLPRKLYEVQKTVKGKTREEVYLKPVAGIQPTEPTVRNMRRALTRCVIEGLERAGYKLSRLGSKVVKTDINYAPAAGKALKIYSAFRLQILYIGGYYYLCLDHQLIVRATLSLASLLKLDRSLRLDSEQRVLLKLETKEWEEGRLLSADSGSSQLSLTAGNEVKAANEFIYPELTHVQITKLAPALGVKPQELERSIKQYSFLTVANAARARLDACNSFAAQLAEAVFPVSEGDITLRIEPQAAVLRPPRFTVGKDISEPKVSFDHVDRTKRSQEILKGLISFGAYDKPASQINLVLVTTPDSKVMMGKLVDRLNDGSLRYPGSDETFGSKMVVQGEPLIFRAVEEYESGLQEFVRTDARREANIALVYLPKDNNINDPRHPYYRVKALLLKEGLASQMVDRSTVYNPDWRDLNLALNIYAKAGHTPWVLDEAMPGVDMFIGLSSSSLRRGGQIVRMMGYVNVFDSYGRWRFYQGDTESFPFEERLKHYGELVKKSVAAYRAENGGTLNSVHMHLTKKFSRDERKVLARAVRAAAPGASVTFVSINPHHPLRLYDLAESTGQISRSTYLRNDDGRIYLATTGSNIYNQRGMGTPIPLELTVWADPMEAMPPMNEVGQQVLSLTRLNWASSKSFCHEPITTKYAGEIAKKMTAFMQDQSFSVNPCLRGTPWFL